MKTLGIITYDANYLKTEQVLLRSIGKYDMTVYALPCVQRLARNVLVQHRPSQSAAVHPRDICERYDLSCVPMENEQIDTRNVVSAVPAPVFPSDTPETLARRHYENEIQMLVHFGEYLHHPQNHPFADITQRENTRRMKAKREQELPLRFERYKKRIWSLTENTIDGQTPLSQGRLERFPVVPHGFRREAA